jgi:hypothetical protein
MLMLDEKNKPNAITFVDLIVEPYVLLFIEYLSDSGRCLCNNYRNDVYNLSIVNSEIRTFMLKHKVVPVLYKPIEIPTTLQDYFTEQEYCSKHVGINIDDVLKIVRNISREQRNSFIPKIRVRNKGKSVIEATAIKSWIKNNTFLHVDNSVCCDGRGFFICMGDS